MDPRAETYAYKTTPFGHQRSECDEHWKDHAWGHLWEQGTGKSKVTIDQAARLYYNGDIDALVVLAPDGVHRNWITDEVLNHLPADILDNAKLFCYQTDKAGTKWHREAAMKALVHPGLLVVAMSYDSITTEPLYEKDKESGARTKIWKGGKAYLWDLLRDRKVLYVADESRRIKNPKADRTKVAVKSSKFARYRRILNGTPVPNGPFDLFSQIQFLDENFWQQHGCGTFTAFKAMFGIFKPAQVRGPGGVLRQFQMLEGYRNLDLLGKILKTIASRVTKEDVLDLPPKLYSKRFFEMTAKQRKVYDDLRDEYMTTLDTGELVAAPLAITRLLRFQQVTSGFLPVEGPEPIHQIGSVNPRLDLFEEIAEDIPHGCIVWCCWNETVREVLERLKKLGKTAVRYDGQVSPDDRAAAKVAFNAGEAQFFVAKTSTAGEGLTLLPAKTHIFLENHYDLAGRLQAEDRSHRIGQDVPVNYIDVCATDSVDQSIVEALVEKNEIACQITGDRLKAWLGL